MKLTEKKSKSITPNRQLIDYVIECRARESEPDLLSEEKKKAKEVFV